MATCQNLQGNIGASSGASTTKALSKAFQIMLSGFVQHPMHIFLEGLIPHELKYKLYDFISVSKYFTLKWLNSRITILPVFLPGSWGKAWGPWYEPHGWRWQRLPWPLFASYHSSFSEGSTQDRSKMDQFPEASSDDSPLHKSMLRSHNEHHITFAK